MGEGNLRGLDSLEYFLELNNVQDAGSLDANFALIYV